MAWEDSLGSFQGNMNAVAYLDMLASVLDPFLE